MQLIKLYKWKPTPQWIYGVFKNVEYQFIQNWGIDSVGPENNFLTHYKRGNFIMWEPIK